MNKITITMAAALLGLTAYAQENTAATETAATAAAKDSCCPAAMAMGMTPEKCETLNIETVTALASNGDPIAQFTLAYMTDGGINTTQDTAKAAEMYKNLVPTLTDAAAKGHAGACCALAHMYKEGKGVEKDAAKAAEYMGKYKECCADKAKAMKECAKDAADKATDKAAAKADAMGDKM